MPVLPGFKKLRQEDCCAFEASLCCQASSYLKNKKKTKEIIGVHNRIKRNKIIRNKLSRKL